MRQALNLLVDRLSVEKFIYGRTGIATANIVNNPQQFVSKHTSYEFNVDKAIDMLDKAGWKPGADGIREKDGTKLKIVYQTSINAPRQKNQQIVKQACEKAGIDVEIKTVPASVYFSSDVGNPDTYTKFYTDIQMYTTTMSQPDPGDFMRQFLSSEVASKGPISGKAATSPAGATRITTRSIDAAEHETDPVKRAALFIQMNDLVIKNVVVIPVVYRPQVAAVSNKLHVLLSGWDSYIWNLYDWYADA